jgi:hypothetical protein
MSWHGFRSLASTQLHELGWNDRWIETQLPLADTVVDGPSAGAAGAVAADVMLDRRCSLWVVRIRSRRSMLTGNGDICGCRRVW